MNCEHFGFCGSCTLYDKTYAEQLNFKILREKERFSKFTKNNPEIVESKTSNFRNRAEFRIFLDTNENSKNKLSYAMNGFSKNIVKINSCSIVEINIKNIMPKILKELQSKTILYKKLFHIEFLSSSIQDILITLIYHKALDKDWVEEIKKIQDKLNVKIIGRSKKQRIVLKEDFINERLLINNEEFNYIYQENGFTQPNTNVNIKMIEWVLKNINETSNDLCELYCGAGNFTIPLSKKFRNVLATEISRTSIKSALKNCSLNNIKNIMFVKMSAQEFVQALNKERTFNRLKHINLDEYNFSTIFVDPPRSGLDETTRNLTKKFENIIYISCNPESLYADLQELTKTHTIIKFALFDQFAYTKHIECGIILKINMQY